MTPKRHAELISWLYAMERVYPRLAAPRVAVDTLRRKRSCRTAPGTYQLRFNVAPGLSR
jgi:hypothetical protein